MIKNIEDLKKQTKDRVVEEQENQRQGAWRVQDAGASDWGDQEDHGDGRRWVIRKVNLLKTNMIIVECWL